MEAVEVKALEKISTEVDESQVKVILSTQCIKAQAFLFDKLRKQSERFREVCGFISSSNFKLDAEIKQAEHEIRSLTISQETIRLANIELKKDWLLAKENRIEIEERVKEGEKKYEDMWLEAKSRYEKIPFVQKYLEARDKSETIKSDIAQLENAARSLNEDIEKKRIACSNEDKRRIVELAEFLVNEMPKTLKIIDEKTKAIAELEKELATKFEEDALAKSIPKNNVNVEQNKTDASIMPENEDKTDSSNDEDYLLLPKLKLASYDLNNISEKLNQIRKADVFKAPLPRHDAPLDIATNRFNSTKESHNDYISPYFNNINVFEEDRTQNFSKRKLINILDDIKIDKSHAYSIVSKANPDKMQTINTIAADIGRADTSGHKTNNKNPIESEEIEEIDMTARSCDDILIPPTQFLDQSMEQCYGSQENDNAIQRTTTFVNILQTSQESAKKRVTFELAAPEIMTQGIVTNVEDDKPEDTSAGNVTFNSQLDESAVSDDLAKAVVAKKHCLDLSPEFVYAKNPLLPMKTDDVITSKFFKQSLSKVDEAANVENMDVDKHDDNQVGENQQSARTEKQLNEENVIHMDVDEMNNAKAQNTNKPITGFLFTHGTQAIPDSLNVSMSTTGYEDGDADFPHCIDSSLLLSPKADLPMPMTGENPEVLSQDVPNFLSGLRKTGLSFFENMISSEPKPDSSAQNQVNSFNFNFGGNDKKTRGGLFSMFQ